jgi:regulator of cell morphogenesis and NO signaling
MLAAGCPATRGVLSSSRHPNVIRANHSGAAELVDNADLDTSVADWAVEHPEAARVFERLGIDYSCAGKSLRYACEQRGMDPRDVLRQLDLAARKRHGPQ